MTNSDPSGTPTDAPRNADELLPPVQPPAATFIMQLFLIPLLIVSVIVGIWMLFSWIANMGTQPTELVNDIEHLNHASWQKALTLANTLRDPRYEHLREDPALAHRISSLLDRQLAGERYDRDNLWLQIYLCRVLGEFKIDDGLPTLLRAADRSKPASVEEVRRSALQAIALLIERIGAQRAMANHRLIPTLVRASQETGGDNLDGSKSHPHRIRSTAAFVLGLLDDAGASDRLAQMLSDPNTDVRFNAATGLARQNDTRSFAMLKAMLTPPDEALAAEMDESLPEPEQHKWLQWKRDLIVANALRAVEQFANDRQAMASSGLIDGVNQVAAGGQVSEAVRVEAGNLLKRLNSGDTLDTAAPRP